MNENESDELTPEEQAEYRRLRLILCACHGFPSAVEAFAKDPDIPDWLWRVVMRKAVTNLWGKIPKSARTRYLKKRERRGRPRKLDDAEFSAMVAKHLPSSPSESPASKKALAAASKKALADHNKAHRDRFVQDPRTAKTALKRARRSGSF